jgi:transcriptional regulator with XRE-family HTH domain
MGNHCCAQCTLHGMQRDMPTETAAERPANRLRELREARGLRTYHLAARYDVDPTTIYRWEQGRSDVPDAIKLALAEFYDVTVAYLMGWPEPDQAAA